jgi:pantoate--beta-alanine ligase
MKNAALVGGKSQVRAVIGAVRAGGRQVAVVPTMGYLHEGHLTLLDRARELADFVVLTIFVNPMQFGPGEDLDRYPRDLERDVELARARGVDLIFAPTVAEMYPRGEPRVAVVPGPAADRLCGASRPGHFRGVLTVVAKLFGIVQADVAVFGQKDFQQAALIRAMAEDLDFHTRIEVAPTIRDADGLAMSSRNVYLSAEEREQALSLSRGLLRARELFCAGESDAGTLRAALENEMSARGVDPEYVEAVDPRSIAPVERVVPGTVLAVAARVGKTRLIDNLILP